MLALDAFVWALLLLIPSTVFIEAIREDAGSVLGRNDKVCCCKTMSENDIGCDMGDTYVPETSQCCKFLKTCSNSYFTQFVSYLVGDYKQTKNPQKCKAGSRIKGGVHSSATLLTPKIVQPKIKIQKSGQKTWEDLSVSNWHKAGAFRLKVYNLDKLQKGDKVKFRLEVFHHGVEVPDLTKEYSVEPNSEDPIFRPGPLEFTEAHMRKEYWLTLRYWRVNGKRVSPPIVTHQLLYAAPTKVCGVSFKLDSYRNCNGPVNEPKLTLKKIPDYALGIEYELVGAEKERTITETQSAAERTVTETLSELEITADDNGMAKKWASHVASFVSLDGNMSSVVNVDGIPCLGACYQLKQCLWNKLGWNETQADAWHIEQDLSVGVMTKAQTWDTLQHTGVPFEIVSPILLGQDGVQNSLNLLSAIRDMGAQAPLSAGLHLHVNTRSKSAGSDITLSVKQIMAVVFSWARFQHIIDEIISPDRVGNYYAKGLYLHWGLEAQQETSLKTMFERTHEKLWNMTKEEDDSLDRRAACEAIIGTGWLPWCKQDYMIPNPLHMKDNPEKFFQINLTPLGRFGTIEFRAGTATLDVNRAARWFQFLVGFVHTFKNTAHSEVFFNDDSETDWNELVWAQMRATPNDLKNYMKGNVEDDFLEYFIQDRPYEHVPGTGCVDISS